MVLMLTVFFPYNLALQGDATRHPRFHQWVSWTWDSLERVKQFLKFMDKSLLKGLYIKWQISRAILSGNFRMLDSLSKCGTWSERLRKCISCTDFSFKIKTFLTESESYDQTRKRRMWMRFKYCLIYCFWSFHVNLLLPVKVFINFYVEVFHWVNSAQPFFIKFPF